MKVKIRMWNDMLREYGEKESPDGLKYIPVSRHFTEIMEKLMPTDRIIDVREHSFLEDAYVWTTQTRDFLITKDMISGFIDD